MEQHRLEGGLYCCCFSFPFFSSCLFEDGSPPLWPSSPAPVWTVADAKALSVYATNESEKARSRPGGRTRREENQNGRKRKS